MLQRLNMLAEEVNDTCDQDLEFSEKEDDDEWILVDLINSCTDFLKEETHVKKATSTDCSQNFSCTSASLDCLSGLTTLKVETSPMENLLIEHPSMSVYAVHNSCQSIQDNSCSEFPNPSQLRTETQNEMGQHISCYVAALAAHATFLEQTKHFRHTQWIKEHSDKHSLTRNSFRRQNLARDCHSRQIKHNSLLVHQPCQRQYNY
uniref:Tumor protein p53-inducible nuclear protein 1 isoform X2 n=1 Tax=Geotrypetes seraphini TaxID=260995 RepID=A0A6P8QNL3_GEOSA|nr:tumor protein p53-inducible nuclear protein 1 isoform X2 [Geotrypetes seraphini]